MPPSSQYGLTGTHQGLSIESAIANGQAEKQGILIWSLLRIYIQLITVFAETVMQAAAADLLRQEHQAIISGRI